jgi:hypothetical protein
VVADMSDVDSPEQVAARRAIWANRDALHAEVAARDAAVLAELLAAEEARLAAERAALTLAETKDDA